MPDSGPKQRQADRAGGTPADSCTKYKRGIGRDSLNGFIRGAVGCTGKLRIAVSGDIVYTGFRSAGCAAGTGTDQPAVSVMLVDAVTGTGNQTHQDTSQKKYLRMTAGVQHRF